MKKYLVKTVIPGGMNGVSKLESLFQKTCDEVAKSGHGFKILKYYVREK